MTMQQASAGKPAFAPIGTLETICSTSGDIVRANVAANLKRDLPRLYNLPDYGKSKGHIPLAIVGGGPTVNKTWGELGAFTDLMVCSSAHDHVVMRGFVPRYAVICEAHPTAADFIRFPDHRCTYLIASMCDASVFDALDGYNVVMWNAAQGDPNMFPGEPSINGGCTTITRGINIAILLGWSNQHFFGFDSSFEDDEYAYPGNPKSDTRIKVRAGKHEFMSTPGWLAQATQFREMCLTMGHFFTPTVHGDGLIAAMMNQGEYA